MNGYIRVRMLPEEDVCPEKLGGKEQSVFKVDIVVPAGILLVVVCFVGHLVPCSRKRLLFLTLEALGIKDVAM